MSLRLVVASKIITEERTTREKEALDRAESTEAESEMKGREEEIGLKMLTILFKKRLIKILTSGRLGETDEAVASVALKNER